jgi:hypothetical protein
MAGGEKSSQFSMYINALCDGKILSHSQGMDLTYCFLMFRFCMIGTPICGLVSNDRISHGGRKSIVFTLIPDCRGRQKITMSMHFPAQTYSQNQGSENNISAVGWSQTWDNN